MNPAAAAYVFLFGVIFGYAWHMIVMWIYRTGTPHNPPPPRSYEPLPPRITALARWGEPVRRYVVKRATVPLLSPPPLPVRIPGAALQDVPDPTAPPHITERTRRWYSEPLDYLARIRWVAKLLNRVTYGRIERTNSDEVMDEIWEDTWVDGTRSGRHNAAGMNETRMTGHGRHRREDLLNDQDWRIRWASYDTQGWPTLATDSRPAMIMDNRPYICDSPDPVPEPRSLTLVSSPTRLSSRLRSSWPSRESLLLLAD